MKELPNNLVDICVTSPPYNLNIKYNSYEDNLTSEKYLHWLLDVFKEVKRILKNDGHLWINMGYSNLNPWQGMDVANAIRKLFVLQNNFVWVKSISIDGDQKGHYKPINSKRFANPTWEHIFHFTKKGDVLCDKESIGSPYKDKSNIERFKRNEDRHCSGNAWFIPYKTITNKDERNNHPAVFPEKLVKNCIQFSGIHEGVLLDPFCGIGTAGLVAIDCGLNFIGFEIDSHYYKISLSLLRQKSITNNMFEQTWM